MIESRWNSGYHYENSSTRSEREAPDPTAGGKEPVENIIADLIKAHGLSTSDVKADGIPLNHIEPDYIFLGELKKLSADTGLSVHEIGVMVIHAKQRGDHSRLSDMHGWEIAEEGMRRDGNEWQLNALDQS